VLPTAERFADLLAGEGVVRGLIGPREVPRLWERHLVNCALLGHGIPRDTDVCDIGTGAGLPGLVLALSRPDLTVTLVEPLQRRTAFLDEAVAALDLGNVEVIRGRAEDLHGNREFTVVTSRAVAPLARLLAWSMPLVRQGGAMLAMKGATAQEEIDRARPLLKKYGAGLPSVVVYGADLAERPTTVVRVEATRPSPLRWGGAESRAEKRTRAAASKRRER
jgi:16S rRNA (guanine527-N7)-methyltransferase